MKILLRDYIGRAQYVWVKAKYNNGKFIVEGNPQNYNNIVSVINDNRKNYVQCSSCGQVFKKGDLSFEVHQHNAEKVNTCLDCEFCCADNRNTKKSKFVINPDGTFTEKTESQVDLVCSRYGLWSHPRIDSSEVLIKCAKRQCADGKAKEIVDTFTEYPGLFDDIITVDNVLDAGYREKFNDGNYMWYRMNFTKDTYVVVNNLGIVSHFVVYTSGGEVYLYYSKKYDKLFKAKRSEMYTEWEAENIPYEEEMQIKNDIAKLYN